MGPLFEQNAHALSGAEKNLVSIVVNMSLEVKNRGGLKQFACLVGQLLSVSLSDPLHLILRQLLGGEKKWPHLAEIFIFHAFEQVRESLESRVRLPCLPNSSVIGRHRRLLNDTQG